MRFCFAIALSLLAFVPTYAESPLGPSYGLSMVGQPKYNTENSNLDYANPDAPKGGVLKHSATGSFDTLNQFSIKGRAAQGLNLVVDRLYARVWDEPFTQYPLIAERAFMPADRSFIRFDINHLATFHDGKKITSEDVLFSFETLREFGRPNMRRLYKLATPEVIDERSIKFTFGEGYDRETVLIFAMMPVLPKHYWQGKEFDSTTLDTPLGSGPYKIVEAEAGKRIVYERVKDYWAKDLLTNKGHHNFDQIIYDYFRDNTVALESFKKGDVSIRREWDAGHWNSLYDFTAVDEGRVTKEELNHGRADKVRGFIFNTRRAPFDDIRVRQALQLLLDFDWINKNLFYDAYKQTNSFYPNTDLSRDIEESAPLTRREKLREANRLLKEAGWVIEDGKRIRSSDKTPMSFEMLMDKPSNEKLALSLTRAMKKMGIEAQVRLLDSAAYRGRLNEYDFDMIVHHWNSTLSPGTEQHLYWSCEAAEQQARWNYAGICDVEVDALAKAIPTAKTREELQKMTQELDQKLWDQALFIPLYYNDQDYVAYWSDLKRPEKTSLYGMVLETWWMEPNVSQP